VKPFDNVNASCEIGVAPEDRVLLLEWIKQFAQRLALKVRR
jgi:hypothetical protein